MAKKRRFITTRQLQAGMKIDQNIFDERGRVLIGGGTPLDDFQIQGLFNHGIMGIYISEGEDDEEQEDPSQIILPEVVQQRIEENRVEDRAKVILSESVKKRVSEGIQFLYNSTEDPEFAQATGSITDELMKALNENHALAVDISALKVSDEYTFKHSVDVATMAMVIAKKYGMEEGMVRELGIAGLLHDVGKSKIPNEVLNKPSRLTDDEFALMKQHAVYGYHIMKDKNAFNEHVLMGVLQHHEKLNGQGYPLGVKESKIHLYARIIAVADIYDALVTERPYKSGFSKRDAIEMILAMTQELDISVMKTFLSTMILYPVDSIVTLSNGEKAKVVANSVQYPLRPTVVGLKSGKVYNLADDLHCANILIM